MADASWQTYAVLGIVLFAVYAAYTAWFRKEGFEEEEDATTALAVAKAGAAGAAGAGTAGATVSGETPLAPGTTYDNKVYVMKLFDTVLHRAATPDEVDRYCKMGSEPRILKRFLRDNRCGGDDGSDSDSDADGDDRCPRPRRRRCEVPTPRPPPPSPRPPPDDKCGGGGGGRGDGGGTTASRVCLDKDDLVRRLRGISAQVNQLYQYINML
jgi:hypothetical protein